MTAVLPVSYTSVIDVLNALPTIGSISSVTSAQIHAYAGQVQAKMDAKLIKNYSLPFTAVVPVIQAIATDLTVYEILVKRVFTAEQLSASPWPDRWKEAMEMLNAISNGSLPIVSSGGAVIVERTDIVEPWSSTQDYLPTFHEGEPVNQIQDEDKLTDILSDRSL